MSAAEQAVGLIPEERALIAKLIRFDIQQGGERRYAYQAAGCEFGDTDCLIREAFEWCEINPAIRDDLLAKALEITET